MYKLREQKNRQVKNKLLTRAGTFGAAVAIMVAPLLGGWAHAASQLNYSTFFGGSGDEMGLGSFVDGQGNYYQVGNTGSTDFPVTANAAQKTYGGGDIDAYVVKFSPAGQLLYASYLGGSGHDEGRGVAVDSAGNIYVSGLTQSANFPTLNASDNSLGGSEDAYLTKISPSGAISYSTYFGGGGTDSALVMTMDSAGAVYLSGETNSSDLPTTTGAYSRTESGDVDTYVSKFNPDGSLVYSSYLGGPGFDDGLAITVDGSGDVFLTGKASPGFPVTAGAYDTTQNGGYDMFVAKFNPAGTGLLFSTYVGGNNWDEGLGIAVDSAGNSYITGNVQSSNWPTTPGAYQTNFSGFCDAVITKLNPTGSALVYSTYIGGSQWVEGDGLAVDGNGNAYIAGHEGSSDYPVTGNALQSSYGGNVDGFLAEVNTSGSGLLYSTYLGGSQWDGAMTFAYSNNIAYMGGATSSSDFPITAGAYQNTIKGADEGFATALNVPVMAPPTNNGSPVVSGNPTVGSTLSTTNGSWTNNPTSYSYQWQSAANSGGPWSNINGATGSSYQIVSGDTGKYLSVQVTASNAAGSGSAVSNVVGPVTTPPGQMTFSVAAGRDDGDVNANSMGSGGGSYPPNTTPDPWDNGTSFGARRAGPMFGGYEVRTGLLRFNTSSLPAGATITSASLRLYVLGAGSDNNRNLVAEWDNAAVWPLTAADYTATPSNTASAGLAIKSLRINAYNVLSLQNLSSISRTGYTTIRLHVDGGQPSGENQVSIASFEKGASTVAQLVINYSQ